MSPIHKTVLVAGGGGFIGGHLVRRLLDQGHSVRCADLKPSNQWHQVHEQAENIVTDLSLLTSCQAAVEGIDEVFNLAADMGGMGFIENNKALCMLSVLINTHLLLASRDHGVSRYFYASSACVYNADKQRSADVVPLREEDAYPAMPEDGYGWEKLFSERMCQNFGEDFGIATRIARFHNVYGPFGTWDGGREKAPAALCRKVIEAMYSGSNEVEVWGDGQQSRSFMYIEDCLRGIQAIHEGDDPEPFNLGSSELVTIDELLSIIERVADVRLHRRYNRDAPKGVNGRNSDNERFHDAFGWEPSIFLEEGIEQTFAWIQDQMLRTSLLDTVQAPRSGEVPAWHESNS
jgi:nucleoside-diphosphate-sugar epimerase